MSNTSAEERLMDTHSAEMCIPYVRGYLEGLAQSGNLPADLRQFESGFSNARRDVEKGVVAMWDLHLAKYVDTLIQHDRIQLKRKLRPGDQREQ